MGAYTKPQNMRKEESEQLRGQRDKIKFIDLSCERWHLLKQDDLLAYYRFHKINVSLYCNIKVL